MMLTQSGFWLMIAGTVCDVWLCRPSIQTNPRRMAILEGTEQEQQYFACQSSQPLSNHEKNGPVNRKASNFKSTHDPLRDDERLRLS
jgi:hypothetical protein